MEGVIIIKGTKPGKTIAIIGGIHGNEVCGTKIIKELQANLKIDRGTVYLIFGNPGAIKKNIRQIDMNLNRAFLPDKQLSQKQLNSYESKRAKELMPYLKKCDASLDIHSSSTPDSIPFVICDKNQYEIVKHFPFNIISSGWDLAEPGATEAFVDEYGGQGICIECGYYKNQSTTDIARKTAQIFMKLLEVIDDNDKISIHSNQKFIQIFDIHITNQNFVPIKKFDDFEKLKKETVIGHDGDDKIVAPKDCYILFSRKRDTSGEEAFLLGVLEIPKK